MTTQDFVKGIDLTGLANINPADINLLVDNATPNTSIGLIITSTDSALNTPIVPDPSVVGASKWKRYLWLRIKFSTDSEPTPLVYIWNEQKVINATYLKWELIIATFGDNTVTGDKLSDSIFGYGLNFDGSNILHVNIQVDNLAELRTLDTTNILEGSVAFVQGYSGKSDGGEGLFVLDKTNTGVENYGTIIVPATGTGLWRRYLVGSEIRPEWFGAAGDGVNNDITPIMRCISAHNRCDFLAKTYAIDSYSPSVFIGLHLYKSTIITGQGISKTTLKLIDSSLGATNSTSWFSLMSSYSPTNVGVDYIKISDLTIDANFANQSKNCTVNCITINGSACIIERVKCINFAAGATGHECFPISIQKVSGSIETKGSIIRECEITSPADNVGVIYPANVPEITCLLLSSDDISTYTDLQQYPILERNYIHDLRQSATQKSTIHSLTIAGTYGAVIRHNQVSNVDGMAVYFQTRHNCKFKVHNNTFTNVQVGVMFQQDIDPNTGIVYQDMLEQDFEIYDNLIYLLLATPGWTSTLHPTGIYFYLPSNGTAKNYAGVAYLTIQNGVVRNNLISGRAFSGLWPAGIRLEESGVSNGRLMIIGNIIDIPDINNTSAFEVSYDNSIVFTYPAIDYYTPESLIVRDNVTVLGKQLYAKLLAGNPVIVIGKACDTGYNYSTSQYPARFPTSLDQIHYDTNTNRIWFPTKLKTAVASGSLVPGKSYIVVGDHVDYDDGGGLVTYLNTQVFFCTTGHLTFTAAVGTLVYEYYSHYWRDISYEKDLPIIAKFVPATYTIVQKGDAYECEGVTYVRFDETDATNKTIIIPDPTYFFKRTFLLVIRKDAHSSIQTKITLSATGGSSIFQRDGTGSNSIDIVASTKNATKIAIKLYSDGVNWIMV